VWDQKYKHIFIIIKIISKHKNNKIILWCNIIFQIDVEQIENNDNLFLLFEDIAQKNIHESFRISTKECF